MAKDMKSLIGDLAKELKEESAKKRTPQQARLHDIAQRLLLLERDLKTPGATRTAEERADRILEAISKEIF